MGERAEKGTARRSEPRRSAELVGELLERLGGHQASREHRVLLAYDQIIGGALKGKSRPDRLRGGVLTICTTSSPLAHELTLLRGEILARLAALLGPGVVTEIRTRVDPECTGRGRSPR